MIFSICMPYYNRKQQLINTIKSIEKSEFINDVEFVIVDDNSDNDHKLDDLPIIFPELKFKLFRFDKHDKTWKCPIDPHNLSIAEATGDVIILQNPECSHVGDIIKSIKNTIKTNHYLVYGCYNLTQDMTDRLTDNINFLPEIHDRTFGGNQNGWYQHSIYRPANYNFCVALTKNDMNDLGGFDERYSNGIAYGDDEFITRVKRKKMNIIQIDTPFTLHQNHLPSEYIEPYVSINKKLFNDITLNENTIKVKNSYIKYISLNEFVDKVYCINLDRRTDRWKKMISRFNAIDVDVSRVSAVDGQLLDDIDTLNSGVSVKVLKAQVATIMSHTGVLTEAINNNYNKICIFEDDVIFCDDFKERFDFYTKNIPDNWDIMYLGCHFHGCHDPIKIKHYIYKSIGNYGCFAMILNNKNGLFHKIIDHSKEKQQPIDNVINELIKDINAYVFIPFFIKTDNVISDIADSENSFSYEIVNKHFKNNVNLNDLYIKSMDSNKLSNKEIYNTYLVDNSDFIININDIIIYNSKSDGKNNIRFFDDYFELRGKKIGYKSVRIKKIN